MKEFDVIVHGGSGFVGRLIAEVLATHSDPVRWALSGRDLRRLEAVRSGLGAPDSVGLIRADSADEVSLRTVAERTSVVISAVGPYTRHGSSLVKACVNAGIGYVDLCGEPLWMREMILRHEADAKRTGARIVFSCGYDSIPFDCGVERLQALCLERWGKPTPRVAGRVGATKGGISGGTLASMRASLAAAASSLAAARLAADPFALTPGFRGPPQPSTLLPYRDPLCGVWVAPFVMAPVNTKNVHRTNMLTGHRYGRGFRYDEMMMLPGLGGLTRTAAEAVAKANPFGRRDLRPGDGPSRAQREGGSFAVRLIADDPGHDRLALEVTGDRDPGYGSTSRMIVEAALCLLREAPATGGIWTPAALMGGMLVARLTATAGLRFAEASPQTRRR